MEVEPGEILDKKRKASQVSLPVSAGKNGQQAPLLALAELLLHQLLQTDGALQLPVNGRPSNLGGGEVAANHLADHHLPHMVAGQPLAQYKVSVLQL